MKTVTVACGVRSYDVALGWDVFSDLAKVEAVADRLRGRRVFIVTDRIVRALHGELFESALRSLQARVVGCLSLEPGEAHKNVASLCSVWDALIDGGVERGDCVAALGGGVVGDVAGLAAATYLRGIEILQFPTTILAMADSSVGGKTAIDHPRGKNLIGAFHQPAGVAADLRVLGTLPKREVLSGLAEVIKAGLIGDPVLFDLLEEKGPEIIGDREALEDALARAVAVKARVVEADEKEGGRRAVLNFGHTVGHSLEAAAGFGAITHGEAVALGMGFATRLSCRLGRLPGADEERILQLLKAWRYPVKLSSGLSEKVLRGLRYDKKSDEGTPRWVLLRSVGRAEWGCKVPADIVETLLRELEE